MHHLHQTRSPQSVRTSLRHAAPRYLLHLRRLRMYCSLRPPQIRYDHHFHPPMYPSASALEPRILHISRSTGKRTYGPTDGYCMDQVTHVVVPVTLDLVSEIAIMLLPSRLLWNLRLPLKEKIGLTATFGLGIFLSATNVVRIIYYARIIDGGNLAWDDIDALIWTFVCMCLAVVCASIPPCAPLFRVWSLAKMANIVMVDRCR
jgi:hypothetical protein